jgi:O-antigen/teichoic acid export membrane protein
LSASELIPILSLASLIYGCGSVFLTSLYAIGKPKIQRNLYIVTAIVFLLSAVPLTYFFSAFGISIAFLMSVILLSVLSFFYVKKSLYLDFNWKETAKIFASTIIASCLLYVAIIFIKNLILDFTFAVVAGLVYLVLLIPMKFYADDDIKILNLVADKVKILRRPVAWVTSILSKFID